MADFSEKVKLRKVGTRTSLKRLVVKDVEKLTIDAVPKAKKKVHRMKMSI